MSDRIRVGVHLELEEEANRIIRESLKGVTKRSEKSDILTPWKEQDRRSREVYSANGVVDAAVRRGMYNRAYNPARAELNSRDGVAPPRTNRLGSLASFVDGHISEERE